MEFTRRSFGSFAALSLAGAVMPGTSDAATAPVKMPANACDAHVHIIGPRDKYPMVENRAYTPPEATVAQLKALRTRLGIARNVLVQPSFYGTDNSCMLAALAELGPTARGIAVVAPTISDKDLRDLDAKGVRGLRINLESVGNRDPKAATAMINALGSRIAPLNWHIQIYTVISVIGQISLAIADSKAPIVIDHFGMPDAALDGGQRGFGALLDLIRARKAYVKLSAPYRISKAKDYADTTWVGRSLIYDRPEQMLWASDWPHTNSIPDRPRDSVTPFSRIDDVAVLARFNSWCPDDAMRKLILTDTPAKLYRFPAAA